MMINNRKAFTFIEALITLAIFTVMMASIYAMFLLSQRAWASYAENIMPKNELRRLVISLTQDLREARNIFIVKDKNAIQLTFKLDSVGEVKISFTPNDVGEGDVIRQNNNKERILAYKITGLNFIHPTDQEIIIDATSGLTKKFSIKQKIALRAQTGLFLQSAHEKIN